MLKIDYKFEILNLNILKNLFEFFFDFDTFETESIQIRVYTNKCCALEVKRATVGTEASLSLFLIRRLVCSRKYFFNPPEALLGLLRRPFS